MSYRSPAPANSHRDSVSRSGAERARGSECPVCLGQHEEDIHVATLRIRRWFRSEVTKGFVKRTVC